MMRRLLHPWRAGRLWPSLVHTVLDLPVAGLRPAWRASRLDVLAAVAAD